MTSGGSGVAGTTVPAFVERASTRCGPGAVSGVSPGLRSRPSLSARRRPRRRPHRPDGVAGTTVPAFVERGHRQRLRTRSLRVSPGLRSRPSLSGLFLLFLRLRLSCVAGTTVPAFVERRMRSASEADLRVSPGLRSRPSLSGRMGYPVQSCIVWGVAGTTVPAFVERLWDTPVQSVTSARVAGTTVPAFVERSSSLGDGVCSSMVSPGLRSRPSLSGTAAAARALPVEVSPGLRSRRWRCSCVPA